MTFCNYPRLHFHAHTRSSSYAATTDNRRLHFHRLNRTSKHIPSPSPSASSFHRYPVFFSPQNILLVLLVLLLLFHKALASSSFPPTIPVTADVNFTDITLPFSETATIDLRPEFSVIDNLRTSSNGNVSLLAQFAANDIPLSELSEHGNPTVLLALRSSVSSSLFVDERTIPSSRDPNENVSCECEEINPCFRRDKDIVVDEVAFMTRAQTALVQLNVNAGDQPVLTLANYNRSLVSAVNKSHVLQPTLSGRLVVRLIAEGVNGGGVQDSASSSAAIGNCPLARREILLLQDGRNVSMVGNVTTPAVCGGAEYGTCEGESGICKCEKELFVGPACEQRRVMWPSTKREKKVSSSNESNPDIVPTLTNGTREIADVHVSPFKTVTVVVPLKKEMNGVRMNLRMLNASGAWYNNRTMLYIFFNNDTLARKKTCRSRLAAIPRWQGSMISLSTTDPIYCVNIRSKYMNQITMTVYGSGIGEKADALRVMDKVVLNVEMEFCEKGCRCSLYMAWSWALLPVLLFGVLLAMLGFFVMCWLDRRHGFTTRVDKLTVRELNRMYPARKFRMRERSGVSGGGGGGGNSRSDTNGHRHRGRGESEGEDEGGGISVVEVSEEELMCSICLCPFEEGEEMRALKCSHMYHAECVDPWLTKNRASCPICRADARIAEMSDRRWLRRVARVFLWPFVLLHGWRERRREVNIGRGVATGVSDANDADSQNEVDAVDGDGNGNGNRDAEADRVGEGEGAEHVLAGRRLWMRMRRGMDEEERAYVQETAERRRIWRRRRFLRGRQERRAEGAEVE